MSKRPDLLVLTGARKGERVPVADGGLRLGRSSSNDLCLPDEELSRNHCLFETDGPDGIRVIDLASANGTFVNGEPLGSDARALKVGDVIEVGASQLQVVGDGPAEAAPAPAPAVAAPAAPAPAEVDLGLGAAPAEEPSAPAAGSASAPVTRKRLLINVLWGVTVLALLTAIVFVLSGSDDPAAKVRPQAHATAAGPFDLCYERVEATMGKIVRYAVNLSGDRLSLVYDAQSLNQAECQKVEESGSLTEYSHAKLTELFEASEWEELETATGPSAQASNALNSWRLRVIRKGAVKEVLVENTTIPVAFRTICETLEMLVNNDLGVQLSLRSPEECLASSRSLEDLGDEFISKAEIKADNLWEGVKKLKQARNELKGLSAYYEDQNRLQSKIERNEARLRQRYEEIHGRAERARQIEDWEHARDAYREIRELIPDTSDSRGSDAEKKLRDIEGRMEDVKRKGRRS